MSYSTVYASSVDEALTQRITAATVQEAWTAAHADDEFGQQVRLAYPNASRMIWPVCTASDVENAYASALAAGNPDPGGDPAVVTDGMILTNVQAKWPADTP